MPGRARDRGVQRVHIAADRDAAVAAHLDDAERVVGKALFDQPVVGKVHR